jgi:hypothetical protein
MGDFPLKDKNFLIATPDILTFDLNELKPKFVILASDGLWDVMNNEAAVDFVLQELKTLRSSGCWADKGELGVELARRLALEAYQNGSLDNISVLVWLFDHDTGLEVTQTNESIPIKPPRTPKVIRESDLTPEVAQNHHIKSCNKSPLSPLSLCNARPLSAPASSPISGTESPAMRSIRDLTYSCAWQSDKSVLRLVDASLASVNGQCPAN